MNEPEKRVILSPDALAYGGSAVGTLPSGKRVFLPYGAPGDQAEIRILREKKNFAEGEILSLLRSSPARTEPVCPLFREKKCPGCVYQHLRYETECGWKQKQLERFLVHSGMAEKLLPFVPSPERYGWRRKITFRYQKEGDRFLAGYTGSDNRTIVPVQECFLASPELRKFIREKLTDPVFTGSLPEGEGKLLFRHTDTDGCTAVPPDPATRLLTDSLPGEGEFQVAAGGFFQINRPAAALLAGAFRKIVREFSPRRFAELYSGVGVFSAAARKEGVQRTCGIESDASAVRCARINVPDGEFHAGDAGKLFGRLPLSRKERTLLLADPPRTGMDRTTAEKCASSPAEGFIYVSCGPDVLARDLEIFIRNGWEVVSSQAFDLFPGTMHFETLTFLTRK